MPESVNQQTRDILNGIEAELADTPEYYDFRVARTEREGEVWKVYVNLTDEKSKGLDESLEGATAWWAGPPKGGADVLSVIAEAEQINLRFVTNSPPGPGNTIRLYPPRYLEALQSCWSDRHWATECFRWKEVVEDSNAFTPEEVPENNPFPWLRDCQVQAFKLVGWKAGFLWGPPGTGKTTTLGCFLAQYLVEFPNSRVLLFSTTNAAVDLALIALDRALEEIGGQLEAARAGKECFRIGHHFIAGNYRGREHLLPVQDKELIRLLSQLEVKRPQPQQVQAYAAWKREVEQIRSEIRNQATRVLDSARLGALTTTRGVFTFSDLKSRSPYDLIVFDEASQVGIAHGLALAPLGTHCIFAGDPQQLSPIVRTEHPSAKRWLGRSMFAFKDDSNGSTCFLNEQSRMAEDICKIVSNVFYKGKLVVAKECKRDPEWKKKRCCAYIDPIGDKNVCVLSTEAEGSWSHKFHGPIRYESAELICELILNLLTEVEETDIIVLTPFRAQRTLIKSFLKRANMSKVAVRTVHGAQGSEQHTVIFDPVMGENPFLQTEEAERLINVGLSRAEVRLILILSEQDKSNRILRQIVDLLEMAKVVPKQRAISYEDAVLDAQFPDKYIGKLIQFPGCLGILEGILGDSESAKVIVKDVDSGANRKFNIDALRKKTLKVMEGRQTAKVAYQPKAKSPQEEFILSFLQAKTDRGFKRIHAVHSGFNGQFKERFPGENPQAWTRRLAQDGKIATERVKGKPKEYEWIFLQENVKRR
jgi:hypothetical protein